MKKESLVISVNARTPEENVKSLRKAGQVPGIIYGNKLKNQTIKCQQKALHTTFVKAGENQLVTVEVDGKKIPCLIHAVSFDPVSDAYEHVDFYAVNMTKKVTTRVPVIVEGESPAVKTQSGILVTVHDELEVSCLPNDIPENFTINISKLENFHDSITVAQLKVPGGVVIKTAPETVIVTVQEPRKEEAIEVPAAGAVEGAVPTEGDAAATPGAEAATAPAAQAGALAKAKTEEKAPAKGKK
ncbi:MAG: 50S ribosomal protein L25 [Candidatus Peribacteraceae bacterium]